MKLYFSPGACSLAPHIVLAELNMVYELEAVNLKDKSCDSGNFYEINQKGSVPALKMENGGILTEASIICQYIADQKNDTTMLPRFGTDARYRCLEWMNYIATEIHKTFNPLWALERISENKTTQEDIKKYFTATLHSRFDFISKTLGTNEYLMGKEFTIADAYLFTCLNWVNYLKMELSPWPNLASWMSRVYARAGVQKAMKEQGLIK